NSSSLWRRWQQRGRKPCGSGAQLDGLVAAKYADGPGEGAMASIEIKSLDRPDETRPFAAKGQAAVVNIGGAAVMRATFEPGWRWSQHVKPLAKTDSCQAAHAGYVLSG